jgi:hypothetical protein
MYACFPRKFYQSVPFSLVMSRKATTYPQIPLGTSHFLSARELGADVLGHGVLSACAGKRLAIVSERTGAGSLREAGVRSADLALESILLDLDR